MKCPLCINSTGGICFYLYAGPNIQPAIPPITAPIAAHTWPPMNGMYSPITPPATAPAIAPNFAPVFEGLIVNSCCLSCLLYASVIMMLRPNSGSCSSFEHTLRIGKTIPQYFPDSVAVFFCHEINSSFHEKNLPPDFTLKASAQLLLTGFLSSFVS